MSELLKKVIGKNKLLSGFGATLAIIVSLTEIFSNLKPISKYLIPFIKFQYTGWIAFIILGIVCLIQKHQRTERQKKSNLSSHKNTPLYGEDYERFERGGKR